MCWGIWRNMERRGNSMGRFKQRQRELFAEIVDIDFSKITEYYGMQLLKLAHKPIDISYARKLEEQNICQIKWYEGVWNWRDMNPTDIVEVGKLLNSPAQQRRGVRS